MPVWGALLLSAAISLGSTASAQDADGPQVIPPAVQKKSEEMARRRCDDGVAFSCYDYGVTLSLSKDPAKQKRGEKYIRQACDMAYAPACKGRARKVVERGDGPPPAGKTDCLNQDVINGAGLADNGTGGQVLHNVQPGSVLEKAGFLPGDVIRSVNGNPVSNGEKIVESVGQHQGPSEIVIERQGLTMPLHFTCP